MSKYYYAVVDQYGDILIDGIGRLHIYTSPLPEDLFKNGETIKRILITDLNKLLK